MKGAKGPVRNMAISFHIEKEKALTVFKATGALRFDEVMPAVQSFYADNPTKHVLWDLLKITDIQLSSEEVEAIVSYRPRYHGKREAGKTAFVAQKDVLFGLSRMFEMESEVRNAPYPIMVFRSLKEALQWFAED